MSNQKKLSQSEIKALDKIDEIIASIKRQERQIEKNNERKFKLLETAEKADKEGNTKKKNSLIESIENMKNCNDEHKKYIITKLTEIKTIAASLKEAPTLYRAAPTPKNPTRNSHRAGGKHKKMQNTKKWKKHNKMRNTKKWKKHNKKHNKMRNTRRPKNLR